MVKMKKYRVCMVFNGYMDIMATSDGAAINKAHKMPLNKLKRYITEKTRDSRWDADEL